MTNQAIASVNSSGTQCVQIVALHNVKITEEQYRMKTCLLTDFIKVFPLYNCNINRDLLLGKGTHNHHLLSQ